jgi:hypothetical protein
MKFLRVVLPPIGLCLLLMGNEAGCDSENLADKRERRNRTVCLCLMRQRVPGSCVSIQAPKR